MAAPRDVRRGLAVLAAVALASAALLSAPACPALADAAAITTLPSGRAGTALCPNGLAVDWVNAPPTAPGATGTATIRVADARGRAVDSFAETLASPGERIIPLWCGDLLGDGSVALGYERFSGGAHCCFTATVVLLDSGGRRLLQADLGNAGGLQPVQLQGAGPLQLATGSDVFAYFADLTFAASPFMPVVYAYDGTGYTEVTAQYPDRLREELSKVLDELASAPAQIPSASGPGLGLVEQKSLALHAYGLYLLLDAGDAGLASLRPRVAPEAAAWLDANAPSARQLMAERFALDLAD